MPTALASLPRSAGAISTCVAVAVACLAQWLGAGDPVDRRLQDSFVRWAPENVPTVTKALPDVAVVAIDPRSLRASEPWPWRRSIHAEAIERLGAAGVAAIAFDIDFSSPAEPEEDARFAEAIAANGRVVLATFSQTQAVGDGVELEIVNRPIPVLGDAAAALGSVLVPIDSDGVVRHAPRSSSIGAETIPSLARAALHVATPPAYLDRVADAHAATRTTLVDFRRTEPGIPTLSYVDLIEGRFPPRSLAGRAVFIGATAAEFQDLWSTPAAPALPGVMIQAIAYRTAAAEAVGLPVLRPAPGWALMLVFALLAFSTLPRAGANAAMRAALFLGLAVATIATAWLALWQTGVVLPVSVALGLLVAQYALGIERLQSRIRATAAAQESSLMALARLGDVEASDPNEGHAGRAGDASLQLALELLGDVVRARAVVLLRARPDGQLSRQRLEWRPADASEVRLVIDETVAATSLAERRVIEAEDPFEAAAPLVYSPLVTSQEPVGVLVVFGRRGHALDTIHRRTIATVSAQLALTAQNLRLIERLRETFESSIAAVASAVEARDGYTDQHCRRLAAFSSLMGARLGLPDDEIRAMELGALLHDVGKIGVPDRVLNKPGRLSNEERREMERHPEIGAGIIAPVVGLAETTVHCVVHHHEKWDGTGYPRGLAGEAIPLAARIVSIVDVWDALSTRRPYKKAFSQAEVRELLMKGRGTHFDPELVDLFFEVLEDQGEDMLELIARSSGQERPA